MIYIYITQSLNVCIPQDVISLSIFSLTSTGRTSHQVTTFAPSTSKVCCRHLRPILSSSICESLPIVLKHSLNHRCLHSRPHASVDDVAPSSERGACFKCFIHQPFISRWRHLMLSLIYYLKARYFDLACYSGEIHHYVRYKYVKKHNATLETIKLLLTTEVKTLMNFRIILTANKTYSSTKMCMGLQNR